MHTCVHTNHQNIHTYIHTYIPWRLAALARAKRQNDSYIFVHCHTRNVKIISSNGRGGGMTHCGVPHHNILQRLVVMYSLSGRYVLLVRDAEQEPEPEPSESTHTARRRSRSRRNGAVLAQKEMQNNQKDIVVHLTLHVLYMTQSPEAQSERVLAFLVQMPPPRHF